MFLIAGQEGYQSPEAATNISVLCVLFFNQAEFLLS